MLFGGAWGEFYFLQHEWDPRSNGGRINEWWDSIKIPNKSKCVQCPVFGDSEGFTPFLYIKIHIDKNNRWMKFHSFLKFNPKRNVLEVHLFFPSPSWQTKWFKFWAGKHAGFIHPIFWIIVTLKGCFKKHLQLIFNYSQKIPPPPRAWLHLISFILPILFKKWHITPDWTPLQGFVVRCDVKIRELVRDIGGKPSFTLIIAKLVSILGKIGISRLLMDAAQSHWAWTSRNCDSASISCRWFVVNRSSRRIFSSVCISKSDLGKEPKWQWYRMTMDHAWHGVKHGEIMKQTITQRFSCCSLLKMSEFIG